MLVLPGLDVGDLEEKVGVLGALPALVDDRRAGDQLAGGHLGDVFAVAAGGPMDGRVEMGADVLPGGDVVPVPGRAALVVMADLGQLEAAGVGEGRRQLDDRGLVGERGGQVEHLDPAVGDRSDEVLEQRHLRDSL